MFGKKLSYVLTDCDGTIINHDLSINQDTHKAIVNYQKKSGYRFSFVTGRLDVSSKKLIHDLKIQLPIISCNGALITDIQTGKILHADYLDKNICHDLFVQAHQLGLDILVYEPNAMVGTLNSKRLETWRKHCQTIPKKFQFNIINYSDLMAIAKAIQVGIVNPVELVFFHPDEKNKQVGYELFAKYDEHIDYVQSLPVISNVMSKGVNKLTGLKHWAKIVGVNWENIVTFGDNHNDIEMIENVKYGYAVDNAVDELKAVAYQVIEAVGNNGVGKQLDRMIDDESE